MKNWLEDSQRMNPYDEDDPLDVQDIAREMMHYWNINFRDAKKSKRGRGDDDDQQSRNTRRRGNGADGICRGWVRLQ